MKKWGQKIRKAFLTGGLSREALESIEPMLNESNYKTWRVIAPCAAVYFILIFLSSFSLKSISVNEATYIVMTVLFAAAAVALRTKVTAESRALKPLIYMLNAALLLFSIMIGVVASPDYLAVTYFVFLIALPMVTLGPPWVMEILLTGSGVVFGILCVRMKSGALLQIELINLVCFWVVSLFLNAMMGSSRLRGVYLQHSVAQDNSRDPLTHVNNRVAYNRLKEAIDRKIREMSASPFAVVVCDVNYLKMVNDSAGHEKGDEYLLRNCQKICQIYRHSPVYRIGGDEFLVYLTGQDYSNREELLNLTRNIWLSEQTAQLWQSISFAAGMAEFEAMKDTCFAEVYRRANDEMQQYKRRMHEERSSNESALEAGLELQDAPREALPAGKRTILVIEDNALNRDMLCTLLEDQYLVLQAENGQEGLNILRKNCNISVVLLDMVMPVMDGTEFLQIVRKDPFLSQIPIIITTEDNSKEMEERCLTLGAKDFIRKPYNPNVLISRVGNMIAFRESASVLSAVEYDEFSGLYTRQAFYHYTESVLYGNPDGRYDLILFLVDDYKLIAEKYGARIALALLQNASDFFKSWKQEGLLLARLGQDTFACLAPFRKELTDDELALTCSKLQEHASLPQLPVSFKLGVYENVPHNEPPAILCERAMTALETIRSKQGKRFARYDQAFRDRQDRIFRIEQCMQEAYEQDQFKVYYQPKHDAATGKLIGAEALIRWIHPQYGFMSPADFIPVFEKNGFITMADYYVWKRTCANLRRWADEGIPVVPISVNSSRRNFENADYLSLLRESIENEEIEPEFLHIEITESLFINNLAPIVERLKQFREAGIQVEMDDFGTGYSSLNALGSLPLDVLKLDMSFMRQAHDERRIQVLKASIALAKSLGLKTIAEGVETEEQLELLRSLGCDAIQGYYFSKPLPEDEFEAYMKKCAEE